MDKLRSEQAKSFDLLCHYQRRRRASKLRMMMNGVEGWEEILEMVRGSQH